MLPAKLRLFLVRHGESEANRQHLFAGHTDSALSELGQAQVEAVGQAMAAVTLDAIYCSPLQRAHNTARAIAQHQQAPLQLDNRLKEAYFGKWEGLGFQQVSEQFGEDFKMWRTNALLNGPTGGENLNAVRHRMLGVYNDVLQRHSGETVLLVGHGAAFNALLCTILQTPLNSLWSYRLYQARITEVVVFERGAVLVGFNKTVVDNPSGDYRLLSGK